MNEVERAKMRERLLALVREEPELVTELLLGLMSGGRFEVVVREERIGEHQAQGVSFTSGGTTAAGYEIGRKG